MSSQSNFVKIDPHSQLRGRWLKDRLSPAATRIYHPGPWPQIGGTGMCEPLDLWNDPGVRSRFNPELRITVAVLSCPGVYEAVARPLHMPVYKISTTIDDTENLSKRLGAINSDQYASCWKDNDTWLKDKGFDDWSLMLTNDVTTLSEHSPVKLAKRGMHVLLPAGLTHRAFDTALKHELASARLDLWAKSSAAQRHTDTVGIDINKITRFTAYDLSSSLPRRSAAEELVVFKPARQTVRLAGIIERLLLKTINDAGDV
jgi:hypothetical protein